MYTKAHSAALQYDWNRVPPGADSSVDRIENYAAIIANIIYGDKLGKPPSNEAEYNQVLSRDGAYTDLRHACPAISTSVTELITVCLVTESNRLIRLDASLRDLFILFVAKRKEL